MSKAHGQISIADITDRGVESITEEYYLSTSKTAQIGGEWTTTPPLWESGKYVWTRSRIIYTDTSLPDYTTPICDSSWEAVNEIPNYIASRGENLVTNGTCLLGDNTNFKSFTYDGSDTYYAGGCFKYTGSNTVGSDEFIPIDVNSTYKFSYYIKSDSATSRCYDMVRTYDIDKLEIGSSQVMWVNGSTTTLAKELKNGDTTVYLTDASGFNTENTVAHQRGLIFWNYQNSKGYTYPVETYSRNIYNKLWEDNATAIDKTTNAITLSSAWSKGTIPSGTPVSHCSAGSNYPYGNFNFLVGADGWKYKSSLFSGVGKNGEVRKFREGTAFVKVGWLINYDASTNNSVGATTKISTVELTKNSGISEVETMVAEVNVPLINGTQTTATSAWTGNAPFSELKDGQKITYWLPYSASSTTYVSLPYWKDANGTTQQSTNSGVVLNLTLSDGTQTGNIACYYGGTTRLTTHFAQGNAIEFTYKKLAKVGSYYYTGWWANANYNSDTTYNNRIYYFGGKTGSIGIWSGSLFMEDSNGTYQNICTASDGTVTTGNRTANATKKANTNGFKIGSTVYYTTTSFNANTNIATANVVYSSYTNLFDSRYAFNTTLTNNSLTPYAPLYLVGTIRDGLYYLDDIWWTQTPNVVGKVYVLVGSCYDSTTSNCRVTLYENNRWYVFNGTSLQDYHYEEISNKVTNIGTEYYLSNSKQFPIGGEWSETQPNWVENKYIWKRNKTIYSNDIIKYKDIKSIGGKAIIWNSLASYAGSKTDYYGVNITNNGESVTIDGTPTSTIFFEIAWLVDGTHIHSGDKIAFTGANEQVQVVQRYNSGSDFVAYDTTLTEDGIVTYNPTNDTVNRFRIMLRVLKNTTLNNFTGKYGVYNLTDMFGAGNEPTIEEFRKMVSDYEPYSTNTLRHSKVTAISSGDYTYPIPDEITSIDGYGFSAEDVYNEIDFVNKKFIKRVGKAVFDGSLSSCYADSNVIRCITTNNMYVDGLPKAYGKCIVADFIPCHSWNEINVSTVTKNLIANNMSDGTGFLVHMANATTASVVKTALKDGFTMYYELDTPVEIDISNIMCNPAYLELKGEDITFHYEDIKAPVSYTMLDGTTDTSYSQAVCDSSWDAIDSSFEAIENIQVGGRNLLLQSEYGNIESDLLQSSNVGLATHYDSLDNNPCYYMSGAKYININFPTLIIGENYIFSCDVARQSAGTSQPVFITIGEETYEVGTANAGTWNRFSVSFVASSETTSAKIRVSVSSDTGSGSFVGYTRHFKLERGNKETDWSLAQEDINSSLEDLNNNIGEVIVDVDNIRNDIVNNNNELSNKIDNLDDKYSESIAEINRLVQSAKEAIEKEYKSLIEDLENQLNNYKADVGQYMNYGDNGLTLGATSSDFKTVIDNRGLYLKESDSTIAYINDSQLYINNAVINKTMLFGEFMMNSSEDGGVSITWQDSVSVIE